jgi:predicted NAD-dependent protein-ADP-ribosyltransferase YbiA (DUF1768 family)
MFYEENRSLEEEDMGHESPVYQITLYDKIFLVAIGKERRLIQKKNTYYFPIYLLNKTKVQTQIGAFEFESSRDTTEERSKPFLDSSGDLDLNRLGDPVFYSFSNYDYFHDITLDITPMVLKELEASYIKEKSEKVADVQKEESDEEDENDELNPFELAPEDVKHSKAAIKTNKVLKDGVFTIDKTVQRVQMLPEETKADAQKVKGEFVETERTVWIEKFMKNNKFSIVETDDNGDCFFDAVRIAHEQIGHITTIAKLRALVAKDATPDKFQMYKYQYDSAVAEVESTEKELNRLKAENKNLQGRYNSLPKDDSSKPGIRKQANLIKEQHKQLKLKQETENTVFVHEFRHMKTIQSLAQFQEYIQTPTFWADDWAIDVLEQELNIKLIIFSKEQYDEDNLDHVLRCSISNLKEDQKFNPDHYVMVSYTGAHYELVSYDSKYIFNFSEIPYDVKVMVVIKCMERNAGLFAQIPEFSAFKQKLGIQADESDEDTDEDEEEMKGGGGSIKGIDRATVFTFHDKASKTVKPGKGDNEKIDLNKIHEYGDLAVVKDWRKMLDDDYVSIFTLENKKWKTVEHYYQAAKFKKHNPHFYNQFSLDDTKSDIAKDIGLAKAAGSQYGLYKKGRKDIPIRPNTINIDPDFYGARKTEERERALYAKFSQNQELKYMIIATKNAVLQHFIPKQKAEKDYLLMKVRAKLQMEN